MNTVVIQQDCYERIREVFDAASFTYSIIPVSQPEEMVRAQSDTGARVFIIGAEPYPRSFYESIAEGSLVVRYGVGYDRVPIDLCKARGIAVGYTPGTLDQSVAEHTVALMLACMRSIPQQDQSVRNGEWIHPSGAEMEGKTAAILGFGQIGRRVAGILKAAFNMRIVAYDVFAEPDPEAASLIDRYTTEYETAVEEADFVCLHMKVTEQTKGFVDRDRLRAMKSSAYLINTARGALINEGLLNNRQEFTSQ